MNRLAFHAAPITIAVLLACHGLSQAQTLRHGDHVSFSPSDAVAAAAASTSSARLSDAEIASALPAMPTAAHVPASAFDLNAAAAIAAGAVVQTDVPGRRPTVDGKALLERRVVGLSEAPKVSVGGVQPNAVGTGGLQFSSTRVYPNASDTTYPTSTIGKLYFRKPNGLTYMCTGSMIKPGVVVTAGHCVHSGNGLASGWYNSFQFIPGFRNANGIETRPYGTWTSWANARTSTAWFSGGGGVPNLRDYAVIVFNRDANGRRIGDYTGWLGYQYPMMIGKQLTAVGYPGNLDSGGQMHRVESLVTDGGTNNGTFGSDMEGGSSGGPIVLNLRRDYVDSSTLPSEYNGNRITSVVSWGYIDTTRKVQGGSQFDATFGTMLTNACTAFPWAC